MIYLKKDIENIYKYVVTIDIEKLKTILRKLVFSCGEIKYEIYTTDYPHIYHNEYKIYIGKTKVGEKEYFEETRDIYEIECYEYLPGPLAILIQNFINNRTTDLLNFLDNPTLEQIDIHSKLNNQKKSIKEKIIELLTREEDTSYKRKQLEEELESIEKSLILNKERNAEMSYLEEIKQCFTYELIDQMNLQEYEKAISFINNITTQDKKLTRKQSYFFYY